MYELPIPLAGHCVVVINNKFVVFLGGGVTLLEDCVIEIFVSLINRHNQIQSRGWKPDQNDRPSAH